MRVRNVLLTTLSLSVALTAATPAAAGSGGRALLGGIIGGVIGGAIGNAAAQQHQARQQAQQPVYVVRQPTRKATPRAPAVSAYQREENRRVQAALNYFGFAAGGADGVMGPRSRAAISQYQAYMGHPATGQIADYEKAFLLSSHDRAIVGGAHVVQMMAGQGQGARGLLLAFRQEQAGVPVLPQPPVVVYATAPEAADEMPAPAPRARAAEAEVEPSSEPMTIPAAAPARLPSFIANGAEGASMASHCARTTLATSTNGGLATAATLADPALALGQQFCLARSYAIEQAESLTNDVQGVTKAEMEAQCEAFAPVMWEFQARLGSQSPTQAIAALQDFVAGSGMPPAQVGANARVCLGIGYRTDNADVAMASALLLVGLGEPAYAELLGHHLMGGFGASKRTDRAAEWISVAAEGLASGAEPLVATGSAQRPALLSRAVDSLTGRTAAPIPQPVAASAVLAPLGALALPASQPAE